MPRTSSTLLSRLLQPLTIRAEMRRWRAMVPDVLRWERAHAALDDDALRRASLALRYRVHSGEPQDRLLVEAFALVREAAGRTLGMRHYPVQLLGGMAMHFGMIAEMQTGEGKTLTAALPLYLAAVAGHGAHLATANDYLAARDAELMRPLFAMLGLTVGVVDGKTSRPLRSLAYQCDITYGTAKEFGFDFLRDRLLERASDGRLDFLGRMLGLASSSSSAAPVQRGLHFVLVDEADSLLIDEARTPLIISSMPGRSRRAAELLYAWAADVAGRLQEKTDFDYDDARREVTLRAAGRRSVRESEKPQELFDVDLLDLYEHVERAVLVRRDYHRDRQYVVRDGEIVIVDEFTGRLAEGRKWRDGVHQAVEAKEKLTPSVKTDEAARITVQDFFLRYDRLSGMTGTASTSRSELKRIYNVGVAVVPTHRPNRRRQEPDVVCGDSQTKWRAIVAETRAVHELGRPVLIGTRSIDKSELLSRLLTESGLAHQVLNARQHAAEAAIVEEAGRRGGIIVATNMAGRGTDIQLGPGVAELGGMHVILSELHESARIDRQLIGRCARQGDPGSYRRYMALDDELLRLGLGPAQATRLQQAGAGRPFVASRHVRLFLRAQARLEKLHFRHRRQLMYHEHARRKMQEQMGQDPHLDTPS